jgi:hemolysin activation/secretion protein
MWLALAAAGADIPTTLPALPPQTGNRLSESLVVTVKGFHFHGNTVFTDKQLLAITEPYRRKHDGRMDSQDLETVRTALTLFYVNQGYINSGAVLPDQTVSDGIVRFEIIEGRLSGIRLSRARTMGAMAAPATRPAVLPQTGLFTRNAARPLPPADHGGWHLLGDSYYTDRVMLGAGPPLNVLRLKDQLELLRREPDIQAINAELAPGDQPGESVLDLGVTERNPFQFGVEYSNRRPPSVGAYEFDVLASDSDLTGHGDALSARWGVLAGSADTQQFDDDNDLSFDYMIPLSPRDLTLEVNYTRSSDVVVETPFTDANIQSKTDSLSATLRQPFVRTVEDPALGTKDQELAGLFTVSSRYNRTFLLGEPFSFSEGSENGKQDVFALRPGVEYLRRTADDALALRGILSCGIDGPNATLHGNGEPDGRFVAFLGQAQYVRRLPLGNISQPWNDTQGILRFNTQLTPDRLLTLEQFSLGGVDTVRGYEQNEFVTDEALQATAELRFPFVKTGDRDVLTLAPFFDSGYAWNRDNSTQTPELISGTGCGLLFHPTDTISASIYYGYPLKHFPHDEDDLQDMGIYFDVTVLAF